MNVTLPDGSKLEVPAGSTLLQVAQAIGPGLAKAAVAGRVDGELRDLSYVLERDAKVELVTLKDPAGLEILRHSASHLMAAAVKQLFPSAQVAIGPAIEDGFYYDFDLPHSLSEQDLAAIEAKMAELCAAGDPFVRSEMPADEAARLFESMGEHYKAEIIRDLGQPRVSLYKVGAFLDLCRGPHLPSSDRVPAFKILHIAGAYWRGDERNRMLTRIYGTAFPSRKEMEEHLARLEEAKRRDHRRLGRELDLFSFHDEAGSGLVYWHPKGALARKLVEDFWREEHLKAGYDFVVSPHIGKAWLWQTSGHLGFYKDSMYAPMEVDGQEYYLKPMNCPFHILIYKTRTRSYRELPLRFAELGTVYRYERSGVLHGMLRVRGFTQDDAHIFMMESQLEEEIRRILDFVFFVLRTFRFESFEVHLSTRPAEFIGDPKLWDRATAALRGALQSAGVTFGVDEGGGAFYGPKIDIKVRDSLGRFWQCSTLQVDFALPERFDMRYAAEDGSQKRPVMLHRALLGSLERFFGILVEHFAGAFPLWMAPVQIRVANITSAQEAYAREVLARLRAAGLRAEADLSGEKINAKVRDAQLAKVPFFLAVGAKEMASGSVSVRRHASAESRVMAVEEFIRLAQEEIIRRG